MRIAPFALTASVVFGAAGHAAAQSPAGLDCLLGQVLSVSEPLASSSQGFRAVDAADDLLAATTFAGSLMLYRVGASGEFELLSASATTLQARQVAIDGTRVCVSVGTEDRILILDATDPAAPAIVGEFTGISLGNPNLFGGVKNSIAVSGDRMYVASATGLRVVDLSDPSAPVLSGTASVAMNPTGVVVRGGFAYVADLSSGLRVFDVSDPATPAQVGTTAGLSGFAVAVGGDFAYLSSGAFGGSVTAVDVSNPGAPAVVGSTSTGDSAGYMQIEHGLLHVTLDRGVATLDLSDPSEPVLIRKVDSPALTGTADEIVLVGGGVCVAGGQTLMLLRQSELVEAVSPASTHLPTPGSPLRTVSSVATSNGVAFLADRFGRKLQALDVSDASSPVLLGELSVGAADLVDVEVDGGVAFVRDHGGTIHAVDVTDPGQMAVLAAWVDPSLGVVLDTTVSGGLMVNTIGLGGLSVLDVSSPAAPVQLAQVQPAPGRSFRKVAIEGDLVAAAGYLQSPGADSDTVYLIDLSDPHAPGTLSAWTARSEIAGMSFHGQGLLVVAESSSNGLEFDTAASVAVLDLSDPQSAVLSDRRVFPVPAGSFWNSDLRAVSATEGRVYLSGMFGGLMDSRAGVTVLELDANGQLGRHISAHAQGAATDVEVIGGTVAVATTSGLALFDRAGCANPCAADLAAPFGELNFFDVAAFLDLYAAQDPAADLSAPFGVWNFFDVSAFLDAYNSGCP